MPILKGWLRREIPRKEKMKYLHYQSGHITSVVVFLDHENIL